MRNSNEMKRSVWLSNAIIKMSRFLTPQHWMIMFVDQYASKENIQL